MWGETGVGSNKNTEATVSEIEMKRGRFPQIPSSITYNPGLVNTFFQKQEDHLITYNSTT